MFRVQNEEVVEETDATLKTLVSMVAAESETAAKAEAPPSTAQQPTRSVQRVKGDGGGVQQQPRSADRNGRCG